MGDFQVAGLIASPLDAFHDTCLFVTECDRLLSFFELFLFEVQQ